MTKTCNLPTTSRYNKIYPTQKASDYLPLHPHRSQFIADTFGRSVQCTESTQLSDHVQLQWIAWKYSCWSPHTKRHITVRFDWQSISLIGELKFRLARCHDQEKWLKLPDPLSDVRVWAWDYALVWTWLLVITLFCNVERMHNLWKSHTMPYPQP